ncbi:MAG: response regulator [Elusimicrobia bacterium]|nr:response regulator [Elusimicrobiota bacterium]
MDHKANILVVDDEAPVSEMISAALSDQGYKVSIAFNGEECVKKISGDKFDLVILDIMMPGMDGIAALGEIKKLDPEVEVIMATGHGTMGTAIQSMRKGAFDYLHKPFEIKELVAVVEKALEKRKFNDITKAIFSTIKSEELLRIIIDSAVRILKADEALLVLLDAAGQPYIAVSEGLNGEPRKTSRLAASSRILERLADDKGASVVLIEDPRKDAQFADIEHIGEVKFALLLPLIEDNRLIGLININRMQLDEYFNENDLQRAKIFASLVSLALRNANLYKQLQETQSQLIQAEKMSALGQLAGGLAHEINNPLSGILGLTQLVLEKADAGAQSCQDLKDIEKAVFRCKKIISSLLSFARQEKTRLEPVNINEVIEETLVLCARQMELKHITIVKEFGPELPPVNGDFQQLMQVFLNLFTNARDAMPDGGAITIRTQLSAPAPDKKELLAVSLADTGAGIPPEILDRVFDPFFTTKPAGKGTGLGLSVCLGIINKHNGAILAKSEPGKGSVFTLYLPV